MKYYTKQYIVDNLLLLAMGLFIFAPSFFAYFVGDNLNQIYDIEHNIFLQSYGFLRPVNGLILWMDKVLWGTNPLGYHLTNFTLHMLNVFLVYVTAGCFVKKRIFQNIAAFIFLLHPIHAMNIFWISGRTSMVCALFFFSSLYLFFRYIQYGKKKYFLLSLLFFLLSLFAKETAVILPVITALYIFIFLSVSPKEKAIYIFNNTLPYIVILVFYFVFRYFYYTDLNISNEFHRNINSLHLIKNMAVFAGLLVIPGGHITIASFLQSHPTFFAAVSVISVIAFLAFLIKFKNSGNVLFFTAFIIISLLPMIRLVMRWYLYIPSYGFSLLIAYMIVELSKDYKYESLYRKSVFFIIALLFIPFLLREQHHWIVAGRWAKKLSKQIGTTVKKEKLKEVLFINNISEIYETPILLFGLNAFVNFEITKDFAHPDSVSVITLSNVSMYNEEDFKKIRVQKIDSMTYYSTLEGSGAYFDFPKNGVLVSKRETLKPGYIIDHDEFSIIIDKTDQRNKAIAVYLKLKKSGLPVLYFSQGKLYSDAI